MVHWDNCLGVDYPTTSGMTKRRDLRRIITRAEIRNERPQQNPHSSLFIGLRRGSIDMSRGCHVPRCQNSYPVESPYEVSTGQSHR